MSETSPYLPPIPAAVARAGAMADQLVRENIANLAADAGTTVVEEPGAPPVPPAAAAPTTVVETPQPDEWKQRYDTLMGKYNSEVQPLRSQVDGLHHLIAQMQAPATTTAPPAAAPAHPFPNVDATPEQLAKDETEFGPDLIAAVNRIIVAAVGARFAAIEQRMQTLSQGQTQVRTETVQQRVMAALDADPQLGKIWRQMNDDPGFNAWLTTNDPFSGQPRKMLLGTAYNAGDASRTANFFRAYLTEHTAPTAAAPVPTSPTPPAASPATGRPTLESLAAPGHSAGNPASGGAPERRVWDKAEITAFYTARTRGVYRGREALASTIEQDIIAAAQEGRVR